MERILMIFKNSKLCCKYFENRRNLYREKYEHVGILKVLYYCCKQFFCLRLYDIIESKYNFTEVLVLYIQKFNVLHAAPVNCWNFCSDNFSVYSLPNLLIERALYLFQRLGIHRLVHLKRRVDQLYGVIHVL